MPAELLSGKNARSGKKLGSVLNVISEVEGVAVDGPPVTLTDGSNGHSLVQ